ncbi:hypothetical protein SAMN05444581_1279 [Methylocapsa palsarum]|uniref:Uncharacterized protein n=2 Tax=Methylocapsa palsarum TaxID=1612308 RepID=A0A1I4CQT3_9HYPH|nr:hypothetical protein SAMN05444581_1279 [Methylocapsa palsarum]
MASELDGFWIGINGLARQKGISGPVMSRRIARLEAQGLIETKAGARNAKLVNLVAYDRVYEKTRDVVRSMNAQQSDHVPKTSDDPDPDPNEKCLSQEQARRTSYLAEMARMDLEERQKKLLPVADVAAAVRACGERIIAAVDLFASRADEGAAAVGKDGVVGMRTFLKALARDYRTAVAHELQGLAEQGLAGSNNGPAA